jgi:S-adenosyl-L-methionine hydrolase (adenosine-forming)
MLKKFSVLFLSLCLVCATICGTAGCEGKKEAVKPIVLLTDFGSADYRVAQVKGIIYSNYPEANLIEASEDVPGFDIATGAFILDMAAREFPANTVFIGIVSPYSRPDPKYFVLTNNKHQIFVLPDNGLLTYVARDMGIDSIYQISNQTLFDQPIGELAAERIQGKVGALIASGYAAENVGPALANPVTLDVPAPSIADNKLVGAIVYVDSFGNCVTNISSKTADEFGLQQGDSIELFEGQNIIFAKIGGTYSDVPPGKEIVFVNNNLGLLQLCINLGNFAKTYNIKAGATIEIQK